MIDILDRIKFARTAYFVENHALGIADRVVLQLTWQQQSLDRVMSALWGILISSLSLWLSSPLHFLDSTLIIFWQSKNAPTQIITNNVVMMRRMDILLVATSISLITSITMSSTINILSIITSLFSSITISGIIILISVTVGITRKEGGRLREGKISKGSTTLHTALLKLHSVNTALLTLHWTFSQKCEHFSNSQQSLQRLNNTALHS